MGKVKNIKEIKFSTLHNIFKNTIHKSKENTKKCSNNPQKDIKRETED